MPAKKTWHPRVAFSFLVSSPCTALPPRWPARLSCVCVLFGTLTLVIRRPPPYWSLSSKSSPRRRSPFPPALQPQPRLRVLSPHAQHAAVPGTNVSLSFPVHRVNSSGEKFFLKRRNPPEPGIALSLSIREKRKTNSDTRLTNREKVGLYLLKPGWSCGHCYRYNSAHRRPSEIEGSRQGDPCTAQVLGSQFLSLIGNPGGPEQGPSVEGLNLPTKAALEVSSIMKKKPSQAKRGLGAKKGSLGAQKLTSTCFNEMEKQAQAVDKLKEQEDLARTAPKEESIVSSLRLAYKDLEIQVKNDEKKNMSGKTKAESERLGMGFGNCRSGISHSATSDMQTIEQETPVIAKPRKKYSDDNDDSYFTSSSRFFDDSMELRSSSFSSWDDSSDFYWKKKSTKEADTILKTTGYSDRPTTRRKPDYEPVGNTDEAQKKFGNVKAISSDMYFGRQDHADVSVRRAGAWAWGEQVMVLSEMGSGCERPGPGGLEPGTQTRCF
ncbi:ADP-ribosylation factor GTPase-activating protein 3 isoform X1 [Myotis lucifugus]|uniref:ADP-ribosylation factor GTPase-activating protein 3 isoform X1 n=1 Tax=Myotis lucifugus TaxID=59463 RepID=UPI000CCC4929|nr:ADP-ribosylation factor GTPase-activating protein 3 isoform X1 [Myotis lucifugus]